MIVVAAAATRIAFSRAEFVPTVTAIQKVYLNKPLTKEWQAAV
jgi:hypothetical protein